MLGNKYYLFYLCSLAIFLKDMLEEDDTMFRKWVATMTGKGEPIEWDELC